MAALFSVVFIIAMIPLLFLFFFFCAASVSAASDSDGSDNGAIFYLNSYSFFDSEPVPFLKIEKDWSSNYRRGNTALTYQWHETGIRSGRWGLGYLYRYNTYLKFNSETAQVLHTLADKQPIQDKSYIVDLEVKSFKAEAVRLFYMLVYKPGFQFQVGLSVLRGEKLVDGTLKGKLRAISESDYNFDNVVLDYYYSKDKFFNHEVARPEGRGYAFDTNIFWQPSSRQKIWINIRDIFGRIDWQDTPVTVAVLESDNKTYDENGYVKVDPLLKGNQSTRDFTQYLPLYFSLKSEMELNKNNYLLIELEHFSIKAYPGVGFRKKVSKYFQGDVVYDPLNRALGFRVAHKILKLSILSDDLNFANAHLFAVSLDLRLAF